MNVLRTILEHKKHEVAERRRRLPLSAMTGDSPLPRLDFAAALRCQGLSVIAEIKRKSPSRGVIRADADPARIAASYREGDASALSVLTDGKFFGALAEDLPRAKSAALLPVLRKDFIIDAYQLYESRHMGADAVLLIVAALSRDQLGEYLAVAAGLHLEALVEVHDEKELDVALSRGATMVGVNNRDLSTLEVDLDVGWRLKKHVPPQVLTVAESGLRCREDFVRAAEAGFDAVLVGESLMESDDPAGKLREWIGGLRGGTQSEPTPLSVGSTDSSLTRPSIFARGPAP